MARTLAAVEGADVFEIGCSYGVASALLERRAARLVGIDIASEPLDAARARSTREASEFHQCDVCRDEEALRTLLQSRRTAGRPAVLFVDIGGEGLMQRCEDLLRSSAIAELAPCLVCVKNRALWRACTAPEGAAPSGAFDNGRYRRAAAERAAAEAAGALGYALDHEPRLVPGCTSTFICRFHNFYERGCTRLRCEFDHEVCYLCLEVGHRAVECAAAGRPAVPR
jgi:SAM-dependent methyltransferase